MFACLRGPMFACLRGSVFACLRGPGFACLCVRACLSVSARVCVFVPVSLSAPLCDSLCTRKLVILSLRLPAANDINQFKADILAQFSLSLAPGSKQRKDSLSSFRNFYSRR